MFQKSLLLAAAAGVVAVVLYGTNASSAAGVPAKLVSASRLAGEPGCCEPAPVCSCPKDRCIKYWNHILGRKACCKCDTPTEMILQVKDPCCPCQCPVEVPVCVPGCCTGTPEVTACCGPLGRGYVTYTWCCGFKIKLVFQRCGDIVVHYHGL